MEQRGAVKRFVAQPIGRFALAALATGTLIGSFLVLGPFIAIPTFLFFGLAIPITLGWKRPRQLAILGLAVLLVAAPLASFWQAEIYRQPSAPAASATSSPYGVGGAVLQDAVVTPFTGAGGGEFNFSVTVHPEFVPANTTGPEWVALYVSTCPGATGNDSPYCAPGYPFYSQNLTLPSNLSAPEPVSFLQELPGPNIYWFQFATAYANLTTGNLTWIFLAVGNGYNGVEGPVTGDYLSTVSIIVPALFVDMFFYPGAVFFVGLLVYYLFKRRQAQRGGGDGTGGPTPASAGGPARPGAAGSAPSPDERHCPNCEAVVYPNEKNCWKCGVALPATGPAPEQLA